MAIPQGLTEEQFSTALNELAGVVGRDWVFRSREIIETYRDVYSPYRNQPDEPVASAAVAPATVEQVQQVVRIANTYRLPLWVFSTGRNYGYGGPAGVTRDAVTLDLKRMNRILDVNEEHAYAVVEPGVSFFELYRYVQERGIKLWLDVPGPGWGSLVGNTLEHGMGYTPYCDRMAFQCGMEVVLPDGDLVRTGMGALPGASTWQMYKHGLGPNVDGLFYQSPLGIVTKMGMWLMPEPETYLSCAIAVSGWDDLVPLVNRMRPLRHANLVSNNATFRPRGPLGGGPGGPALGPNGFPTGGWDVTVAFYGPEKIVDQQWEHVRDVYATLPGVEFRSRKYKQPMNRDAFDPADRSQAGVPGLVQGHPVFMSPVLPFTGEACLECIQVFDRIAQRYGRRYFGSWMHADSPHSIITTSGAELRAGDEAYNRQSVELAKAWIREGAARGWGAYRIHTALMDDTRAIYSFNDHALLRLHHTLKDALDPNGVLAPGKNGIWPKELRDRRGRRTA